MKNRKNRKIEIVPGQNELKYIPKAFFNIYGQEVASELGKVVVPPVVEATICVKRFSGDIPRTGDRAVVQEGRLTFRDGKPIQEIVPSELNGNWYIIGVKIASDHLEIKLEKYIKDVES